MSSRRGVVDPHRPAVDEVTVECNGKTLRNWLSLSIGRRLDAVAGTFQLSTRHVEPWPIKRGSSVRIYFGDELALTGIVDNVRATIDANSAPIEVSGRDRTGDLVDCSAPESPTQFFAVSLAEIAEHVAAPLGIEVVDEYLAAPLFEDFRIGPDEKAFSAIERGCRLRSLVAHSDELGRLVLARPGQDAAAAQLEYGVNVLAASFEGSDADRFRFYVVKGQQPGSDNSWGAAVAAIRAEAVDGAIERNRRLTVVAESAVDQASADAYARWLATVRAARSATLSVQLASWRQTPGGPLWRINQTVPVFIPRWRLNGAPLLINAVRFQFPSRRCTLELVRADAYSPEPIVDKAGDPFNDWADDSQEPDE